MPKKFPNPFLRIMAADNPHQMLKEFVETPPAALMEWINEKDSTGQTPLHQLVLLGPDFKTVLTTYLAWNADPTIENNAKQTAMDLAAAHSPRMKELLYADALWQTYKRKLLEFIDLLPTDKRSVLLLWCKNMEEAYTKNKELQKFVLFLACTSCQVLATRFMDPETKIKHYQQFLKMMGKQQYAFKNACIQFIRQSDYRPHFLVASLAVIYTLLPIETSPYVALAVLLAQYAYHKHHTTTHNLLMKDELLGGAYAFSKLVQKEFKLSVKASRVHYTYAVADEHRFTPAVEQMTSAAAFSSPTIVKRKV
jgi:hypothetical protein